MTTKNTKTEILHEERGMRVVRLEFNYFGSGSMEDLTAQLGEGLVTLTRTHNERKPKSFTIDPANMDRLCEAWLQFRGDNLVKEAVEMAAYQAEIDATKLRATAVDATMIPSTSDPNYDAFSVAWPASHPLERFNRHWTHGNEYLTLDDVKSRLKHVKKHMEEVQTKAVTDKRDISPLERQIDRAQVVGATLVVDSDNLEARCALLFPERHTFHGFWQEVGNLTPGHVEYRLRYVEGVLNASK